MSSAKKFCSIHLDKIESSELIIFDCDHSFCRSCLFNYITSKLSAKDINFVCPYESCFKKITHYQIKEIIKKTRFDEIYENLLIHVFKSDESEKVVSCLNCKIMYTIWNGAGQFNCTQCRKKYCAECFENWEDHAKLTCEELKDYKRTEEDRLFESYIREKKFMKCPQCGIPVEKIKYCNIIYCSSQICEKKTAFCYLCGEKLTDKCSASHFIDNNTYSYQCIKTFNTNPIDKLKKQFVEMRKEEKRAFMEDQVNEEEMTKKIIRKNVEETNDLKAGKKKIRRKEFSEKSNETKEIKNNISYSSTIKCVSQRNSNSNLTSSNCQEIEANEKNKYFQLPEEETAESKQFNLKSKEEKEENRNFIQNNAKNNELEPILEEGKSLEDFDRQKKTKEETINSLDKVSKRILTEENTKSPELEEQERNKQGYNNSLLNENKKPKRLIGKELENEKLSGCMPCNYI